MKLIIFDIDGTLCHSRKADDKSYLTAFKKVLNIDIENTDWDSYKNVTDYYVTHDIIFNALKFRPDDEIINKVIDAYAEELKIRVEKDKGTYVSVPGSIEVVNYLLNNNDKYVTGVATGGFNKTAKFKLELLGFNFADENLFCSGEYRTKFEMIEAFIKKESNKGDTLEDIFYIGDRLYDYYTAMDAGIKFIGIDYDRNNRLKDAGVIKVMYDYLPVENFIKLFD